MKWLDGLVDWYWGVIGELNQWSERHELLSNQIAFWIITLGFLACSWVGWRTWWSIRGAIDETQTGLALKRKKLAEGIAWLLMAILFGVALARIYGIFRPTPLGQNGMRLLAGFAVWIVAGFGLVFVHAFERDAAMLISKVTADQNEREVAQNEREIVQNQRDVEGAEPVNVRQDEREIEQNVREKFQDDREELAGNA